MPDIPRKRVFSPEAKQAAIETRRRNLAKNPPSKLQVFVVRLADAQFGWEIRKFGSLVLDRSETGFGTQLLALEAGKWALSEAPWTAISG